jgi:phage terminase large subunit-like protein
LKIESLTSSEKLELAQLLDLQARRKRARRISSYYPAEGALRRELYPRHLEFFRHGSTQRERLFMAANRVGKTEGAGGYEMALHLTGEYPDWWEGRRFAESIRAWAAGDTSQTVRDILQFKLLGPIGEIGTGLIPADAIIDTKRRAGNVPDLIETVRVRHKSGGVSVLGFKSYDQGREAFQGTEQDIIWLDEEPDSAVYGECLIRTMTTGGLVMLTFTPLRGLSDVVLSFLPDGRNPAGKCVVMATWDDVPHLSDKDKADMLAAMPPHMRDARSRGIPALGSGAIYPIAEDDITTADFEVPAHWPRVYALDVGWNNTAALWGAWDRDADILYLTAEYKRGQCEPAVHAQAVKSRGEWIPGVVDPASAGANQKDGSRLMDVYRGLGLEISPADNSVEAGILAVWERMSSGRLKAFKSLQAWLAEYRLYRRDEKGRIVKDNDHLMDCMRYLVMSGMALAKTKPAPEKQQQPHAYAGGWMGA